MASTDDNNYLFLETDSQQAGNEPKKRKKGGHRKRRFLTLYARKRYRKTTSKKVTASNGITLLLEVSKMLSYPETMSGGNSSSRLLDGSDSGSVTVEEIIHGPLPSSNVTDQNCSPCPEPPETELSASPFHTAEQDINAVSSMVVTSDTETSSRPRDRALNEESNSENGCVRSDYPPDYTPSVSTPARPEMNTNPVSISTDTL